MYRTPLIPIFSIFFILPVLADPPPAEREKPATLDSDPHLLGWWKFEEESGNIARDSSPHGHHGTLEGGLSFESDSAPGRAGKALKFDGGKGAVEIKDFKGIAGTKARTVAVWIQTRRSRGDVVSWGTDDFGKMWIFRFIRGRLGVTPRGGYYYMNPEVHDGQWHHVAVVLRQADPPNLHDHVTLYRDGKVAEVHDIGLLDLAPIQTGSDLNVRIGTGFQGLLDDFRIYDRPLSADEIQALFSLKGGSLLSGFKQKNDTEGR